MKKIKFEILKNLNVNDHFELTDSYFSGLAEILNANEKAQIILAIINESMLEPAQRKYFSKLPSDDKNRCQRFFILAGYYSLLLSKNIKLKKIGKTIQDKFFNDKTSSSTSNLDKKKNYIISDSAFINIMKQIIKDEDYLFEMKIFLRDIFNKISNKTKYPQWSKQFMALKNTFNLTEVQLKILSCFYLTNTTNFCDILRYSDIDVEDNKKCFRSLAVALNLPLNNILKELHKFSVLRESALITKESEFTDYQINETIFEFINSSNKENILDCFFHRLEIENTLPISSHRVEPMIIESITKLISSNLRTNILFYGEPGTGKTEMAKSLASSLDMPIYSHITGKNNSDISNLKAKLITASKVFHKKKVILLVDEADDLLDSSSSIFYKNDDNHKTWVNMFLESHEMKIIWIINDDKMHKSTKRRFDIAIHFKQFNQNQRKTAIKKIAEDHNLIFSDEEVAHLARNYRLDPASFSMAANKASQIKDHSENLIKTILDGHKQLILGEPKTEKPIEHKYDINLLNTNQPISESLEAISSFFTNKSDLRNLCFLFQGNPGTGKTELTKYISEHFSKELIIKRASDILSSLWGQTEKNIADIFSNIDKENEILFLDECDSLFKQRESAEKSWMVSETNELLTQMEKFEGILICATNFVENLDRAAMRRFHFKIKYNELNPDQILKLYKSWFSSWDHSPLTSIQEEQLFRMKGITPGDFKAIYNSCLFATNKCHNLLISRLSEELNYKNLGTKKIGL